MTTIALLASDRGLIDGLLVAVEQVSNLHCVGIWQDVSEGLRRIPELEPDLILISDGFHDAPSPVLVSRILKQVPGARVMVICRSPDSHPHSTAMRAGACACLILPDLPDIPVFLTALTSSLMCKPISQELKCILGTELEKGLTAREHEVSALIVDGCTNKEIAGKLNIRPLTVRDHLKNIFWKLDVSTRTGLAVKYSRFLQTQSHFQTPL